LTISETVRNLRKQKGWSQARLAMEAHVSQQAISFIERGRNEPSAEMLRALADTLGVSVSEIMGESSASPRIHEEDALLQSFRRLNRDGRDHLMQYLDYLLTRPELKKGEGSAI